MSKYRVIKYYETFFAHYGYRLERRTKFLWWEFWDTIEVDGLGIKGYKWAEHFGCKIIEIPER